MTSWKSHPHPSQCHQSGMIQSALLAYTVKSITAPDILSKDRLKLVCVTSAQMYEPYLFLSARARSIPIPSSG